MWQNPSTLTNLLEPSPFTFVESFYDVSCASDPLTWTEWRTAYINGLSYSAETETIILVAVNTEVTYTFPSLLLTMLTPGDVIIMVFISVKDPHRLFS
jgi:hypothetical protein